MIIVVRCYQFSTIDTCQTREASFAQSITLPRLCFAESTAFLSKWKA